MSDTAPMNVLGAIDYQDRSLLVVQHCIELLRHQPAAEAHFLHVSPAAPEDMGAQARRTSLLIEWLGQALRALGDVPGHLRVIAHEAQGDPAAVVVHTAHQLGADLIVVGTHQRKGVERLLGSVTDSVMRHAERPVLVVRPKAAPDPRVSLEPACPLCVEARVQSRGARLWCDQHTEKHGRRHTYYDNRARSWTTQPWFLDGAG